MCINKINIILYYICFWVTNKLNNWGIIIKDYLTNKNLLKKYLIGREIFDNFLNFQTQEIIKGYKKTNQIK